MNKIKNHTKEIREKELKGMPESIILDQIDPNDSIVDELMRMDEADLKEQLIVWYQHIKYLKAGINYLKERLTK